MTDDPRTASRLASDPPDALREEIERRMIARAIEDITESGGIISTVDAIAIALEVASEQTAAYKRIKHEAVLAFDTAAKQLEAAEAHVRNHHLEACVSCAATESRATLVEAALDVAHSEVAMHARDAEGWYEKYEKEMAALAEMREKWGHALACGCCVSCKALGSCKHHLNRNPDYDPRCAPEVKG